MRRRAFAGSDDLGRLQRFSAEQIRMHGRIGLMHPGDVPHRVYNGLRRDDPLQLVHIWEDPSDGIAGWTLLDPRGAGFDVQMSPGMRKRHPNLEHEINVWSEETLLDLMRDRRSEAIAIETDAFDADTSRIDVLTRLGWVAQSIEILMLARRPLDVIEPPQLPAGYSIRTVRGVEEAGPVSKLHAASFGSSWTPDLYRRVMESPGYHPSREFLVEAPDGALAAFCVTWPDNLNRTGLFEPVAVDPEHRKLGLGRALMREGMAAMASWGMEYAEVAYETTNPGSGPLYRSEGFVPEWKITLFKKPISL